MIFSSNNEICYTTLGFRTPFEQHFWSWRHGCLKARPKTKKWPFFQQYHILRSPSPGSQFLSLPCSIYTPPAKGFTQALLSVLLAIHFPITHKGGQALQTSAFCGRGAGAEFNQNSRKTLTMDKQQDFDTRTAAPNRPRAFLTGNRKVYIYLSLVSHLKTS